MGGAVHCHHSGRKGVGACSVLSPPWPCIPLRDVHGGGHGLGGAPHPGGYPSTRPGLSVTDGVADVSGGVAAPPRHAAGSCLHDTIDAFRKLLRAYGLGSMPASHDRYMLASQPERLIRWEESLKDGRAPASPSLKSLRPS
ncbi:hypothetical protein GCM10017778_72150 [Streptomyces vinaceus]|nr:hypothetical protein GCM10017778_72150 [Streptomyces vinaceus]